MSVEAVIASDPLWKTRPMASALARYSVAMSSSVTNSE